MKISKAQLRKIIKESLLLEIGPGVGMGDGDLKHAKTDPQNILAALSILPPVFIPSVVASAVLYYLSGDKKAAANTLAFTAALGGAGALIRKLAPAVKAAFRASGKSSQTAAAETKNLITAAEATDKLKLTIPPDHPALKFGIMGKPRQLRGVGGRHAADEVLPLHHEEDVACYIVNKFGEASYLDVKALEKIVEYGDNLAIALLKAADDLGLEALKRGTKQGDKITILQSVDGQVTNNFFVLTKDLFKYR